MNETLERMLWAETPAQRFVKLIHLYCGVAIGCIQLVIAFVIHFTFRGDEPWWPDFFLVMTGYLTLPAAILSFVFPEAGGAWLVSMAVLSFLAIVQVANDFVRAIRWVLIYSFPMLTLGVIALLLSETGSRLLKTVDQRIHRKAGD